MRDQHGPKRLGEGGRKGEREVRVVPTSSSSCMSMLKSGLSGSCLCVTVQQIHVARVNA